MRKLKFIGFLLSNLFIFLSFSCSKVKEIPVEIQPPLVYQYESLPNLQTVLATTNGIDIYKELFKKTDIIKYIDSVRKEELGENSPFTLFVPLDEAWIKKGYTLEKVKSFNQKEANSLLKYLTIRGRIIPDSSLAVSGGITYFPIISPSYYLYSFNETSPEILQPNKYSINLAVNEESIFINGIPVGNRAQVIKNAKDGTIYFTRTLPEKPTKSLFQILQQSADFSLYLTALRISNRVYQEKMVGISPLDKSDELLGTPITPFYNFYSFLKSFVPNNLSNPTMYLSKLVFAPDNEAFKKFGLKDSTAIQHFINKSYIFSEDYKNEKDRRPMFTNMDSILNYTFMVKSLGINSASISFEYSANLINTANNFLYTNDFLYNKTFQNEGLRVNTKVRFYNWRYFDDMTWEFSVTDIQENNLNLKVTVDNNKTILQRTDSPNSKKVMIKSDQSNITALDGVLHRVDNLFLPNP